MLSKLRTTLAGLGALCLVGVVAAGCTPVTDSAEPESTPTASSTPTLSPSPTPTEAPAELAGCDTVLTQAGNDDLASSNLTPREFEFQSWDYPLLQEFVANGVVCKWGNTGDVIVVVGQLAMSEDEWESTRAELEATGYVPDDSLGVPGYLDGPDPYSDDPPNRGFVWRDGILYYASYTGILEFVPVFQQ